MFLGEVGARWGGTFEFISAYSRFKNMYICDAYQLFSVTSTRLLSAVLAAFSEFAAILVVYY